MGRQVKSFSLFSSPAPSTERKDGYLPLNRYAALGDGRSIALSGADGSIDWWCAPEMDSPPIFDRLLSADDGGNFRISPTEPFTSEQRYRAGSNVHETIFTTETGTATLVEALNSGAAGLLPWSELARRISVSKGTMAFDFLVKFGTQADQISPYYRETAHGTIFHIGDVMAALKKSGGVEISHIQDDYIAGRFVISAGQSETIALILGGSGPLVLPPIEEIDARIDLSCNEWKIWSSQVHYDGPHRDLVVRSALALKLLLYSPSGAITAAATTSLPEAVGGPKNYDYRYAWIRDAGYTIKAFLRIGAEAEAMAATAWLLKRLGEHGPHVMYTLDGDIVPDVTEMDLPGWRNSKPVRIGNWASSQHQHAIYGDIFETVERFVECGNILDHGSAQLLEDMANQCADNWRKKDSGIWELPEEQHYTNSKLSCWQALARAVELADKRHIPAAFRDRWARERDRVAEWIDAHCWCEKRQAYLFYPESDGLDASVVLAVRFRFGREERLQKTIAALDKELGKGAFHYRYSRVHREEGCFLACTFWIVEAKALLGDYEGARATFDAAIAGLGKSHKIYSEMIDAETGEYLGNIPQGLTHLAVLQAAATLAGHPL